jgi:hypothetical protein
VEIKAMTCAMVLSLTSPFSSIDARYGVTKGTEIRIKAGARDVPASLHIAYRRSIIPSET